MRKAFGSAGKDWYSSVRGWHFSLQFERECPLIWDSDSKTKWRLITKIHVGITVLFSSSWNTRGAGRILIPEKAEHAATLILHLQEHSQPYSWPSVQIFMVDALLLKSQQIHYAASFPHARVWTTGSPWVVFNCLLFLAKKSCWCPIQLILYSHAVIHAAAASKYSCIFVFSNSFFIQTSHGSSLLRKCVTDIPQDCKQPCIQISWAMSWCESKGRHTLGTKL